MNVKDLLDYEALPEETRKLAEAYWAVEVLKAQEEGDKEYEKGYEAGARDAECSCEPAADLQDEVDELRTKIAELKDEVEEARVDGYERGYSDGQSDTTS